MIVGFTTAMDDKRNTRENTSNHKYTSFPESSGKPFVTRTHRKDTQKAFALRCTQKNKTRCSLN